jgi:hypothetical protein
MKTVKALLGFEALARVRPTAAHFFCPDPACPVVYYDDEQTFTTVDVRLPIFQKDAGDAALVCYCFGYSRGDVRRDEEGTIAATISGHVKAGRCACDLRNPQGTCCLGNVNAARS